MGEIQGVDFVEIINYFFSRLSFWGIKKDLDGNFINNYMLALEKAHKKFKRVANCEKTVAVYNGYQYIIPQDGLINAKYIRKENYFEIVNYDLLIFLQIELNIKSKKKVNLKKNINFDKISATDISNYSFCPVNYSISKTIEKLSITSTEIGIERHSKSILKQITRRKEHDSYYISNLSNNDSFKQLKSKILKSDLIYEDDGKNEKIFKSNKGDFVGKPDFIFKDENGDYFVIEKKYQRIFSEEKNINITFYENHINQTASYIYGISEYNIKYGLLVYWKYTERFGDVEIKGFNFKTITRNDELKNKINNTYSKIKYLNENKIEIFDISNRNAIKCANCVNTLLCGHKTGKFNNNKIPYDINQYYHIEPENIHNPIPSKIKSFIYYKEEEYLEKIIENIEKQDKLPF